METATSLSSRVKVEQLCIITLAGPAAARRSVRGSGPGWMIPRSREEVTAYHESGHILVAHILGRTPYEATVLPVLDVRVGKGKRRHMAGFARYGWEPNGGKVDMEQWRRQGAETDMRTAAALCWLLTSCEGWRSTLQAIRFFKHEAELLIDANWYKLTHLAQELRVRKHLDEAELAQILCGGAMLHACGHRSGSRVNEGEESHGTK
jgi:DNA-binding TFAR19-related protein (PDSD5 family)